MRLVRLQLRVVANPYLRAVFADGRYQHVPRTLGDSLRLFAPHTVTTLKGFDALHRLLRKTGKDELRPVAAPYLCLKDGVEAAKAQRLYLVAEQLVD